MQVDEANAPFERTTSGGATHATHPPRHAAAATAVAIATAAAATAA